MCHVKQKVRSDQALRSDYIRWVYAARLQQACTLSMRLSQLCAFRSTEWCNT